MAEKKEKKVREFWLSYTAPLWGFTDSQGQSLLVTANSQPLKVDWDKLSDELKAAIERAVKAGTLLTDKPSVNYQEMIKKLRRLSEQEYQRLLSEIKSANDYDAAELLLERINTEFISPDEFGLKARRLSQLASMLSEAILDAEVTKDDVLASRFRTVLRKISLPVPAQRVL